MNNQFEVFAQKICEYCMRNYVVPYLQNHGVVMSYRAEVKSVDAGSGTMTVQRPFDTAPITLPYASGAAGLTVGSQCVVFSLGDALNSVVVSDGKLSSL